MEPFQRLFEILWSARDSDALAISPDADTVGVAPLDQLLLDAGALEFGVGKVNLHGPPKVVQCPDFNPAALLPVAITMPEVPVREEAQGGVRCHGESLPD